MLGPGAWLRQSGRLWSRNAGLRRQCSSRSMSQDYDFRGLYRGYNVDESSSGFQLLWSKMQECQHKGSGEGAVGVVQEWRRTGNETSKELMNNILLKLYSCNWYLQARKLTLWLNDERSFELSEEDELLQFEMLCRLGYSFDKVMKRFEELPEREENYVFLIRAFASNGMIRKAEQFMKKLKASQLMKTARAYTVMLRLYARLGGTYVQKALWTLEEYEASGLPPDPAIYLVLLSHRETIFTKVPVFLKTEEVLDKLEMDTLNRRDILRIYAALGKSQGLEKAWNEMKSSMALMSADYIAAIDAFGLVGEVEKAEGVSRELLDKTNSENMSDGHRLAMLKMYSMQGLMDRAEVLMERHSGGKLDFEHCHPLVLGYLRQKQDFDKALEWFNRFLAMGDRAMQPHRLAIESLAELLSKGYAVKGDVKGAEELLTRVPKLRSTGIFNSLLKVYIGANEVRPEGFLERMTADKVSADADTKKLLMKLKPAALAAAAAMESDIPR